MIDLPVPYAIFEGDLRSHIINIYKSDFALTTNTSPALTHGECRSPAIAQILLVKFVLRAEVDEGRFWAITDAFWPQGL